MRAPGTAILALTLCACGHDHGALGGDAGTGGDGAVIVDGGGSGSGGSGSGSGSGGSGSGSGSGGSGSGSDGSGSGSSGSGSGAGIISGGPCASGAPGAAAYRFRWTGQEGGTATVQYEVDGLPDHSRDHAGAFGFQIGFTPTFTDTFLGDGGLQLDASDFIDVELSTAGVSSISRATLAIYGRSFDTTTSGGFAWQTFDGTGATADDLVSNVAPYQWYTADMTTEIGPGESGALLRITASGLSGSLVVNRVELCLVAQ